MSTVTTALVFDTKKTKNPDLGILKVRVTYKREKRPYTTGLKVCRTDWERLRRMKDGLDNRVKDEEFIRLHQTIYGYKDRKGRRIEGVLDRFRNAIEKLGLSFTFELLKDAIKNYGREEQKAEEKTDVIRALIAKKEEMIQRNRVGNGLNYGAVAKSLARFTESLSDNERRELGLPLKSKKAGEEPPLRFVQITPAFLDAYEDWMLKVGKTSHNPTGAPSPASSTTIGIYLRHLRAVYNDAIRGGIIPGEVYPFGRGKFIIPAGRKPKKALGKGVIEQIKAYKPLAGSEQRAHDLWLFTYYGNGLNMSDLAQLKWKDVDRLSNSLSFVRQKTRLTRKGDTKAIRVALRPETWAIIDRWSVDSRRPDEYVFSFLSRDMNAQKQKSVIAQLIKQTNKYMKRIADKLGVEANLVTYAARHSYATALLRSGAPMKFISDSLGHGSLQTTETYFGDFEDDDIQQYLKAL